MAGVERALGVNEDVYCLLHRHALDAQRAAVRAVDPVVARSPKRRPFETSAKEPFGRFSGRKMVVADPPGNG